jgi:hypothetical protein
MSLEDPSKLATGDGVRTVIPTKVDNVVQAPDAPHS